MKVKKVIRRLFIFLGVLIILLIGALFAIPYFFKDELMAELKTQLNENLRAETEFSDVQLSLFKSFPDVSVQVMNLDMVGIDQFEGVPLLRAQELELEVDLMSLIYKNRPYEIERIRAVQPLVNVLVLANGEPNYDVTGDYSKEVEEDQDGADNQPSTYQIQLKEYEIVDGEIKYEDLESGVYLHIVGLDHGGSGNFTASIYDLDTRTFMEAMTVRSGGVEYMDNYQLALDAVLHMNMPEMKFSFKENQLTVNDLQLNFDGFLQLPPEEWDQLVIQLDFQAPDNNFKQLLSLIPGAYTQDFQGVKASGDFSLEGRVDGNYDMSTGALPPFEVGVKVTDGRFQYPDLPMGVDQIQVQGRITSPSSDLDEMKIDFPRFNLRLGDQPLTASFGLRTPISDPDLRASVKGRINLADLASAYPLEGVDQLAGLIQADVNMKARMSMIEKEAYEQVQVDGQLAVSDLAYAQKGLPTVSVKNAAATFSPQFVEIQEFAAKVGKSDFRGRARVDNLLAYFSPQQKMTGTIFVRSNYFDVDEWMVSDNSEADNTTPPVATSSPSAEAVNEQELFNRFDFKLDGAIQKIGYADYDIRDVVARGHISAEVLQLDEGRLMIGQNDFATTGYLSNWWDYVFHSETLGGKIQLTSNQLNLNDFMTAEEAGPSTPPTPTEGARSYDLEALAIPANVDLQMNARVNRLQYADLIMRDISGDVRVANREARITNCKGKGLGGTLAIEGGYNTQEPQRPRFDFKYNLSRLDFQESFNTLNTFQQLAPIGNYIAGDFNSTLTMSGELGQDLMPDFSTLDATGFLETLDAVIQNFRPLGKVGEQLNLNANTKNMRLDNTRNWFEVKNGRLTFEDTDYTVEGIDLTVGGTHSITGSGMDFNIKARVPREKIDQNTLGAAATSGVDWATSQANQLGLDLKKAAFFNFDIGLSGTIANPKVKVKLLGADGETSFKAAATQKVKEEVQEVKEEAEQRLEQEKQKVKEEAEEKVEEVKEEAQKKAEETKEKVKEEVKKEVDKKKDELEDKLKKWNPFKKKD